MSDLDHFVRLAAALQRWRHQLMFVGGWAHRLFRQHSLAEVLPYAPVATRDADVAFSDGEKLEGSILAALSEAGFAEELTGEHEPPVSHYTLGEEAAGFYAEFLTPLRGSGRKRNGKADATVSTANITAQKLRHLEILFLNPWTVPVRADANADNTPRLEIILPNPVTFIVQKVLIHGSRYPGKRAQDMLYIHDTFEMFGPNLPALAEIWTRDVAGALTRNQRKDVIRGASVMFESVTDTTRAAARIPQDRTLDPERMRASCAQAMARVLG